MHGFLKCKACTDPKKGFINLYIFKKSPLFDFILAYELQDLIP